MSRWRAPWRAPLLCRWTVCRSSGQCSRCSCVLALALAFVFRWLRLAVGCHGEGGRLLCCVLILLLLCMSIVNRELLSDSQREKPQQVIFGFPWLCGPLWVNRNALGLAMHFSKKSNSISMILLCCVLGVVQIAIKTSYDAADHKPKTIISFLDQNKLHQKRNIVPSNFAFATFLRLT